MGNRKRRTGTGTEAKETNTDEVQQRVVVYHRIFEERPPNRHLELKSVLFRIIHRYCTCSIMKLPIFQWTRTYDRTKFFRDLIAGLSVGVLLIPQSMAYASLAGLPPVYGLYTAIIPVYIYALLASSTQLAFGPVAPVAILLNAAIRKYPDRLVEAALTLSFLTGVIQLVLAMLRFGFIANLLSWPVMSGYTTAAAFIIAASQFEDLLQLKMPDTDNFVVQVYQVFAHIKTANLATSGLGIVCVIVLVGIKYVKFKGRSVPKWFPIQLVVVIISVILSSTLNFKDSANMHIVGKIPAGFKPPGFPVQSLSLMVELIPKAFIIALISYVGNISLGVVFGKERGEEVSANLELLAVGASSTVGSFFNCFPSGGSFSRTAVNFDLGARTPAANMVTATLLLCVLLFLAPLFQDLPKTVLAAMIIASCKSLVNYKDAILLWKSSNRDFLLMAVTFIACLAIGIDTGVIAAVGFSLALLLYRSFQPRITELARFPGTDVFMDKNRFPATKCVDGVIVLRIDGELHFGNIKMLANHMLNISRHVRYHKLHSGYPPSPSFNARSNPTTEAIPDTPGPQISIGQTNEESMKETNSRVEIIGAGPSDLTGANMSITSDTIGLVGAAQVPREHSLPYSGSADEVIRLAQSHSNERSESHRSFPTEGLNDASTIQTVHFHKDASNRSNTSSPSHPKENTNEDDAIKSSESLDDNTRWSHLRGIVLDGCRVVSIDAHACRELAEAIQTIQRGDTGLCVMFAAFPGPVRDTLRRFDVHNVVGPGQTHLTVNAAVNAVLGAESFTAWQRQTYDYGRFLDSLMPGVHNHENITGQRHASDENRMQESRQEEDSIRDAYILESALQHDELRLAEEAKPAFNASATTSADASHIDVSNHTDTNGPRQTLPSPAASATENHHVSRET